MRPLLYNAPSDLRAFLEEQGLGLRKRFGQNFLINPEARTRLIDALGAGPGDEVWEIGPGLGAMTGELLDRGVSVQAFEIDPGFIRILKTFFGGNSRFSLIEGDVLKTWRTAKPAGYLLGNLPYRIGARLLGDLIEGGRNFTRLVVMVQREVGQRIIARPGSPEYSSFSVMCASAYRVRPLMVLKGGAFYPVPHVDSQGLQFDFYANPREYPPGFYELVRRSFGSRRKTLKNNLRGWDYAEAGMRLCGIAPDRRAETLELSDFIALASALEKARLGPAAEKAGRISFQGN
ncbi:MAG: 16S rRNA (adenine(1518)-N(6)/adenine(1519)-N(6))-dimethyltransferase RsmA [Spirochaetaceae bacterium]|jgi:16S rRNA (adenine1518-N6/adenine1519-N6)-dimethyltransferase|nr:16S rRNA (adenine(1518)-N(6)/adenine(1519)-N(6))-dimethyltransferase RsmA [Spirochaetaceae bacterium]